MTIICTSCRDTGMTYEGNGHRMASYPYAEKHTAVRCGCSIGLAILGHGYRWSETMPPVREVSEQTLAKIEARKVRFAKRLDVLGNEWAADYQKRISQPGYKIPQWMVDQGEMR